jgi:broad specificity phosphatase PhoE
MARFYFVRHGHTDWTREKRIQGQADVPLSQEGRDQAQAAARHLAGNRFHAAYASDLSRALVTAGLVLADQAEHAPELIINRDLREISDGTYEGWLFIRAAAKDPRLVERRQDGLPVPDFTPPEGESIRQLYLRQQTVASLLRRHRPDDQVLVVGHGWALRALAAALLGEGPEGFWKRQSPLHASLSIIEDQQGIASVAAWGDMAHLSDIPSPS